MISFRRCAGLLLVALALSACLTGCSEGAAFAKQYEMANNITDKCVAARKAQEAYLAAEDETNYRKWWTRAELACTEMVAY